MSDMNLETTENVYLENIGKAIVGQILLYSFLTLSFFIALYDNPLIYYIAVCSIWVLFILFFLRKRDSFPQIYKILSIVFIVVFPFLASATYNIYHYALFYLLKNPIGLDFNFSVQSFFMYFGFLTIFAIISEAIILYYYYRFAEEFPKQEEGYGIWDYFLTGLTWKKGFLLITLLLIASIVEEIIFRFILINVALRLGINIIIIIIGTALIFGLVHYQNGGWLFTINSTFAGIFFALAFIEMGFYSVWFLHFVWNFLVIFQMIFPRLLEDKLIESREKGSQKGTKKNYIKLKF